ncbi:N-acetylneuraminate 9-O-acetyltransferase-like isoform X2 [Acanthaster planci]|uniref:N-acetylneuraminate 9-O-acetyltransferase-like isoform X2 n=1 Tax=Acanthaster planci TaxID=133434 RepID=A0A8B8A6N6_ACAPL|nr:N-acetylneuraminate 9-O-acetyltransferase-like isoform X2 [Acanthaster planci]
MAGAVIISSYRTILERISTALTERNGKKVAAVVLALILTCHGFRRYYYGRDTCMDLMNGGRYLGPNVWQPAGCMMHQYTVPDSSKCLEGQRVLFIGDSRMRQLYFSFAQRVTSDNLKEGKYHENLQHTNSVTGATIEFLWQPEMNDSLVKEYSAKVSASAKPVLVVLGVATWTIKLHNAALEAWQQYRVNMTQLLPALLQTEKGTKVVWMMQAPVQESLLSSSRRMISNKQLDLYNTAAADVLANSGVYLWYSAIEVSNKSEAGTIDGIHLNSEALHTDTQLLLNLVCNSKTRSPDTSCCTGESFVPNLLQMLTFCFFISCGVISVGLRARLRHIATQPVPEPASVNAANLHNHVQPSQEGTVCRDPESSNTAQKASDLVQVHKLTSSLAKFGIILLYFFLADRTDFLYKEQKFFTYKSFFIPLVYVLVLGLFFVKKVSKPVVLNVPQTTEWKGWMQLAILIYHITGASRKIPIYMHIRILVASYLFQTAYGQFTASWDKQKFGLVRVCQVLFRQNLLVVSLCLVMNRPYQFYYFVPLVSFWYLLIYTTMALPPRVTQESASAHPSHYVYMLLKIGVFFTICVTVSMSEIFFNSLFNWWPINTLFYWPGQSLHEWWFRWRLDRFIIIYGMLFAMGYIHLRVTNRLNDSHSDNLFSTAWTVVSNIVGFIFIAIYTVHSFMCSSKPDCNEVHTFISALPITGLVILRNSSGSLRTRYSTFFAWFGTISLELFISQYHIWLAQDTKGILVLIPGHPSLNLLVSTFIFIFIAHEISCLTAEISKCVVSEDYATTRNRCLAFLVFLGLLLAYSTYG